MIVVKVQLSLAQANTQRMALVYNEDRSVRFEGVAFPELIAAAKGRPKFFCNAELEGGKLDLWPDEEVPDPGW